MKKLVFTLYMLGMVALAVSGCTTNTETTATTTTKTTMTNGQPVEIVSVLSTYKPGQTVNPGGPEIEMTLKNVSDEPVVYLTATLELLSRPADAPFPKYWRYGFNVTDTNPLLPGKSISTKIRLIGGGFDGNYDVSINGTMQSGVTFTYTK